MCEGKCNLLCGQNALKQSTAYILENAIGITAIVWLPSTLNK